MLNNGKSLLRRRVNFTGDIESGQTQTTYHHHHHHQWSLSFIDLPLFFICKCCALLDTYKKRVVGVFFLVMEAVSVVVDVLGKNRLDFLLAAFVLSALGFAFTFYAYIKTRSSRSSTATTEVQAERQLRVVELVFSSIQFIASFMHFLLASLKVDNNYDASVFPLAFAMIAVVFVFKNDEKSTGSPPAGDYHQPIELDLIGTLVKNQLSSSSSLSNMRSNSDPNMVPSVDLHDDLSWNIEDKSISISPKGHMTLVEFQALNFVPDSTPIEADDRFEVSSANHLNPLMSTLRMRTNVTSKMEPTTSQANHRDHSWEIEEEDVDKILKEPEEYKNVLVQMPDTGAQKTIDLQNLTCYEELYKKVSRTFNIELEYLRDSKWVLIYEDEEDDLLYLGNESWMEFLNHAKKIYIHEKDKLGNSKKDE